MMSQIIDKHNCGGTGTLCEGAKHGRCPIAQQGRPGRHHATAGRRATWSRQDNSLVMKCYFLSEPERRGYRKRMHQIWLEYADFEATEQRLLDQKNHIMKKQWLSELEIQEIRCEIEEETKLIMELFDEEDDDEKDFLGFDEDGQSVYSAHEVLAMEEALTMEDETRDSGNECADNMEGIHFKTGADVTEEDKILMRKVKDILSQERRRLPALRAVDRNRLERAVKEMDTFLGKVETSSITEANDLVYCGAYLVSSGFGMVKEKQEKQNWEPWWKRRLDGKVKEMKMDLEIIEKLIEKKIVKKKQRDRLERKYNTKQKKLTVIKEEIRQRITAKKEKIKRYQNRINQFRQNRTFQNNQGRFYKNLDSGGCQEKSEAPDAEEAKTFWNGIWGQQKKHNKDAEWLKDYKEECARKEKQEKITITMEKMMKNLRKMPNWKAPGPDMVQGFWLKNFKSMHSGLVGYLQGCLNTGITPDWMTKGRTPLIQKDRAKGNVASNYRPITCLPLVWKLLTGIIADEMYTFLDTKIGLPEEQKGCRKKSKGCHDQLFINRMIMREVKMRKRNLSMAWIDYKKAYDMVPHSWILDCMDTLGIDDHVQTLLRQSMKRWKVELTCGDEVLGEIGIKRGIFQGDALSPLLFVVCLMPLSYILNNNPTGYEFASNGQRINHLLFMDDLKLYAKSERALESLVESVRIFSKDIGMEFGIDKCAVLTMKRGKLVESHGVVLPNGEVMKGLSEDESYKYLGILEADSVKSLEMKEKVKKEYLRRVRKILESKLNGGNLMKAINTWAISLLRYSAAFIDWNIAEAQTLDRRTRKLLTMHGALHPKSDVDRLYLPRKDGGRGLISVEDTVELAISSLEEYVQKSTESLISAARLVDGDMQDKEPTAELKKRKKETRKRNWRGKKLHGQFVTQTDEMSGADRWTWLQKGTLKRQTECLIMAAQEQSLRTNTIKVQIDRSQTDSKCRVCKTENETVRHIVSGCSKLAQRDYKRRHDMVGKRIHWEVCKKYGLKVKGKWYDHVPEAVVENHDVKILWDFTVQTDHVIGARKPDLIVVDKKTRSCKIVDFCVPYDTNVEEKETEKIMKYQHLSLELQLLWKVKTQGDTCGDRSTGYDAKNLSAMVR